MEPGVVSLFTLILINRDNPELRKYHKSGLFVVTYDDTIQVRNGTSKNTVLWNVHVGVTLYVCSRVIVYSCNSK
jgi:hypothetical protein